MARSRREKSASISSATAPVVNGSMPPPSPASPTRSGQASTRRRASSNKSPAARQIAASVASLPPPKSKHAPAKPSRPQFAVAVLISLVAESAGLSIASLAGTGELASISKLNATPYEIGGLVAWKVALLAVCWFVGLDAVDVASLNTLVQTPIFVLLHYFYLISAPTLLATCTISILAPALPFYLLRPLSAPHSSSSKGQNKLRNRIIINDPITTLATSATATIVYATTLQFAFSTFLPVFLVVHFNGLRDLSFAHNVASTLPTLFMWLAPAGVASTQFLFRPAEGAASSSFSATGANSIALTRSHFDPRTATFAQHIYHNVWGWYTSRQKELIGRTIILGVFLLAETVVHVYSTINGVDAVGAVGYAGLWLTGAIVLGIVLEWVGGPSD